MRLRIERRTADAISVLDVEGQLDLSNCHVLHEAVDKEVSEGRFRIVLNLKLLSFIDSSCLGSILGSLDEVKKSGGDLAIVGNPLVERIITLTGLRHILSLHATVDGAIESLSEAES